MRTSSCRALAFLAAQSLGFGLIACSSSTAMKPAPDAAVDTRPLGDAPFDATAAGDLASPKDGATGDRCTGSYDSCMCSCCGTIGRAMMCYYPTLGESVATLAAADQERWASTICGVGACSSGVHYLCCTPADPEPSSGATYTASGYIGGYDHLRIDKAGADCASLMLNAPAKGREGFHIDAGALWAADAASFGPCGDAGAQTQAKGALGTLTFRTSGGACVMDLHATLFAISDAAALTTARMDADGIPMPSSLGGYCP